jgi:hypothetical protein
MSASDVGVAQRGESPAQYTSRVLAYVGGRDPWSILEATPDRLRTIILETPHSVLRATPASGKWSAARIITHLADAEIVVSYRYRLMLAHNGIAITAFDQDAWADNLAYEAADLEQQVDLFTAARRANLGLLRRVDPKLHENYCEHNERGRETVAHMIRLYAGHDLNHLGQIERILAASSAPNR